MAKETNEALEQVKGFWEKYSKKITYIGAAVIIVASGIIGYQKLIKEILWQ